jgi:predicted nucleotidyltransferase
LTLPRAASTDAAIVDAVRRVVDADGVILCGSRATGEARDDSDHDVYVVVSTRRLPSTIGALRDTASALELELGVPVSLNPLPRFRLRRPGRSYLVWKTIAEGRVLDDRRLPALELRPPSDVDHARASYAISGLRYLVAHLQPKMLGRSVLPPGLERDVRKALLHAAQLQLLALGRYASTLEDALTSLDASGDGRRFRDVACRTASPSSWIAVRRLLMPGATPRRPRRSRALLDDTQFLALSRLAGEHPSPITVVRAGSVTYRAWMAVIALASAVGRTGALDPSYERAAIEWIEPFAGATSSWREARDRLDAEWSRVEPLVGL